MICAVSKSTCAPSTAAHMIFSGAGKQPLVLSRSTLGAMASICATPGVLGVPPGIL